LTQTDRSIDEMMARPRATQSRRHIERVIDSIKTPAGRREFWRAYRAAALDTPRSWAAADRSVTSAGQLARGVDMLAPDVLAARLDGGIEFYAYKAGA